MADDDAAPSLERRKVWSWPTRLFHWALVASVTGGWYLGEFRSFSTIELHFWFGYVTLGLIAFRIAWGIFGPEEARLSALLPHPRRVVDYLRGALRRQPSGVAGHNPLGALSVLAMLIALTIQGLSGLFADDDALFSEGPLAATVESGTRLTLTALHDTTSRIVLVLVVLHLAAILFYAIWKRENLVRPMITGWKLVRRRRE